MASGLAAAAFYQWNRTYLNTEQYAWDTRLDSDLELLENMSLTDAWANWLLIRDSGIGPYIPPMYVRSRMVSQYWWKYVKVGLSMALVGLVVLLSAFVIPRRDTSQRRRPPRKRPSGPQDRR